MRGYAVIVRVIRTDLVEQKRKNKRFIDLHF